MREQLTGDLRMSGTESGYCLVPALTLLGAQRELNKLCIIEFEDDEILVSHQHCRELMWTEAYHWGARGGLTTKMNREPKLVEGGLTSPSFP
jgi:hypothetical protein